MPIDLTQFVVGGGTRPDAITGLNPKFQSALATLFAAAPPEIQAQMRISSGYRSPEVQAKLYQDALAKYGSEAEARRWVAPPGHSQHNHGTASDLKYLSPEAQKWAHANAGQFGLAFPLSNENWHIELAGARGNPPAPSQPLMMPTAGAVALNGQPGSQIVGEAGPSFDAPPMQADPNAVLTSMFAQSAARSTSRRAAEEKAAAEQARRAALFAPVG